MKFTSVQLGTVVTIVGGGTPDRSNPEYWGGTVPWASVKDLKSCCLTATAETITEEGLRNSATNLIPAGNVIVATRMALGKAAINEVDVAINQDLKAMFCEKGLYPRYLLHFLNAQSENIQAQGKGATVKGITIDVLKELQIPLPPLDEQRRIAAILDKADAIRRKRQESIRLTEEFLRSTFLELFGDPVTNPKGWTEIRLEDIADIQSGITKGRKLNGHETMNVPYMRVANVQDGHIALGEIKEFEATPVEIERYRLLPGDILLTEGGDPDKLGRGAVWQGEITPCIHQNHIFRVRPNADKVLPDYLSALIGSVRGKQYFLGAAKQTTGIASINKTQLSNFPALLPPIALQRQFTETVRKIEAVQVKLSTISELQGTCINSLTHRAFRGEL